MDGGSTHPWYLNRVVCSCFLYWMVGSGSAVLESPLQSHQTEGLQFASAIWSQLCSTWFITGLTMAYHQQANGMVERFHQQLKVALRARLINHYWHSQLLWVLLGLQASPKEDCGLSSVEMVYGEPLMHPGQFLNTSAPSPDLLEQLMQSMARFVPPAVRLTSRRPPSCTSRGEQHPQPSLPSTRDPTRC